MRENVLLVFFWTCQKLLTLLITTYFLKKLYKFGIRGNDYRRLQSYLDARKKFVNIDNNNSLLNDMYFIKQTFLIQNQK